MPVANDGYGITVAFTKTGISRILTDLSRSYVGSALMATTYSNYLLPLFINRIHLLKHHLYFVDR